MSKIARHRVILIASLIDRYRKIYIKTEEKRWFDTCCVNGNRFTDREQCTRDNFYVHFKSSPVEIYS